MKSIQKIIEELGVAAHTLHRWEKDGWLGNDPVIKDPKNNNARLYDERQLERIYFLHHHISGKREKGIKKIRREDIESLLFEEFGGEVIEIEKNEIEMTTVLPSSMESLMELVANQNKKLAALEEMVRKQVSKELPDYTEQIQEVKNELKLSQEREEKKDQVIQEMNEKLNRAVDFILEMEEKEKTKETAAAVEEEPKKGLLKRIFGL